MSIFVPSQQVRSLRGIVLVVALVSVLTSRALARRIVRIEEGLRTAAEGYPAALEGPRSGGDEIDALARQGGRLLARQAHLVRVQKQMSDHVAHEIRTPLMHLDGRIAAALQDRPEPGDGGALTRSRGDIRGIVAMLDSLLDIASNEGRRGDLAVSPHPDDVRVVHLGQGLGLGAAVGGGLERHQSLHRPLPGQEHAGERPLPQPHQEVEIVELFAGFQGGRTDPAGNDRTPSRGDRPLQPFQLGGPVGEALEVFTQLDRLAGPLADGEFLADQVTRDAGAGQLLVEGGLDRRELGARFPRTGADADGDGDSARQGHDGLAEDSAAAGGAWFDADRPPTDFELEALFGSDLYTRALGVLAGAHLFEPGFRLAQFLHQ